MEARKTGTSPQTFDELKKLMLERHDLLSKQLRRIARFALDHPDTIALETVTSVAAGIGVQPSAIVRFAKAFDLDGFSDLQRVFRARLMANTDSYRNRIRSLSSDGGGGPSTLLDEISHSAVDALERLRGATPPERLEKAIKILRNARDIHLLGFRRSFPVVQYFHYALSRLETRSLLLDGAGGMLKYQTTRCRPDDVVIAVSFAPYTEDVVETVKDLAGRGIPVISITDSPLSPLAAVSEVCFEVPQEEFAFRSLVAPMCLAQTIVVGLGQAISGTTTAEASE